MAALNGSVQTPDSTMGAGIVLAGSNTILTGFNAKPGEVREEPGEIFLPRTSDPEDSRRCPSSNDTCPYGRVYALLTTNT
jgi:hypothetical protein